jgi:hypothetical protein
VKYGKLPPDSQTFMKFMDWLFFCDWIAGKADPMVAESLAANVIEKLTVMVGPMISKPAEDVAIAAMTYMTACVTQVRSPKLLAAFVSFLVGGRTNAKEGATPSPSLAHVLIERCNHGSEEVSTSSLRLLLQLLSKRNEQVLNALVLQYITETPASADVSGTDAVHGMRSIASTLLSQVPKNLRSADDEESYRLYFIDAQDRSSEIHRVCKRWTGAGKPVVNNGAGAAVVYTCASPFVAALTTRLRSISNQEYMLNLLVTAIISALLEFPHEAIHQCLLGANPESIVPVMAQICTELKAYASRVDNVTQRLHDTRKKLVSGVGTSNEAYGSFLHAMIIFEDFSKELVARALVHTDEMLLAGL